MERKVQWAPRLHVQPEPVSSFKFFCGFWTIANDIAAVHLASPEPLPEYVPLAFAESKYRSLLQWANELPPELCRSPTMSHSVAEMQSVPISLVSWPSFSDLMASICYHATIMDLFRPYLREEKSHSDLSAAHSSRPEYIFHLSLAHLRELVIFYHRRFNSSEKSRTISWVHGPMFVVEAIIYHQRGPNQVSDFWLCMSAFSSLLESHPVVMTMVTALFNLAMDKGLITYPQITAQRGLLLPSQDSTHTHETFKTEVIIDQDLALNNRGAASASSLATLLNDKFLFDDFVVPEG